MNNETAEEVKYSYNWDDSGFFTLYQQTPFRTNVLHCFEGYPGDATERLVEQITDALNASLQSSEELDILKNELSERLREIEALRKVLADNKRIHENELADKDERIKELEEALDNSQHETTDAGMEAFKLGLIYTQG